MPLSKYQRERLLMAVIWKETDFGGAAPNYTTYLALSSTEPNIDGTGVTEPSGNGYQRIPVRWNIVGGGSTALVSNFPSAPTWDSETGKYSIANERDIMFYEATGSWGTLPYFAIYTAATGGNMVACGSLTTSISPVASTIPIIRTGNLIIKEEDSE